VPRQRCLLDTTANRYSSHVQAESGNEEAKVRIGGISCYAFNLLVETAGEQGGSRSGGEDLSDFILC
jgi:hypothetical protein